MWVWVWLADARACEPVPLKELAGALQDADRALGELDASAFDAAVARATELVPCVSEPVPVGTAAALHRVVGLVAFGKADPLAPAAFAAARRLEPADAYPSAAIPADSPVNEAWRSRALMPLEVSVLPAPAEGWIAIDGQRSADRPVAFPAVFQRLTADGRALQTGYLRPGDPDPVYAVPLPAPVPPELPRRPHAPLAVTSAATGALALGAWGLAVHGRSRYLDLDRPVPDSELDGLRVRTNALAASSVLSAGVCALTATALAVTW